MDKRCLLIFLLITIICLSVNNCSNIVYIHKLEHHIEKQDSIIKTLHELLTYD